MRGEIRLRAEWPDNRQSSNFRPVGANRPDEIEAPDPPIKAIPCEMMLESQHA